jgi:lipopolysaccharide transport system permease protein
MQYAGAALGSLWFLIQGMLLLFLYLYIADGITMLKGGTSSKNIPFILSGVLFWIPIQEMIQKSTTILTDNRAIIKRSGIGLDLFYLIPVIQMLIHVFILSIPAFFFMILLKQFSIYSILIYPWMILCALFLYPFLRYLSMTNVLLKDISPIIRLFLQFGFWTLPILYFPSPSWSNFLQYHPLLPYLDIFRAILLPDYSIQIDIVKIILSLFVSLIFFKLTSLNFTKLIPDHL